MPLLFFTPRRRFRSTLEMRLSRQGRRAHARCLRNRRRELFSIGSVGTVAHCKDPLRQSPTPLDNLVERGSTEGRRRGCLAPVKRTVGG
jgi:hypothetical protein